MPVRLKIAENAGMPDYRAYMWKQKFRFDYSPEDCKSFHAAIEEVVVPAAQRVHERRRQRLGIDTLRPWDINVDPLGALPSSPMKPWMNSSRNLRAIFEQVDPKFGEYFQIMMDEDLLDLESRKNKAPGAIQPGLARRAPPIYFYEQYEHALGCANNVA